MPAPIAQIRPFRVEDAKDVTFAIGKANMQLLAVANTKGISHWLTLATWVALSSIFVKFMQWWPKPEYGYLGYLNPLPAFACVAVPIFALIDWINRPYFEGLSQEVLRKADLRNISEYYNRSPSSGFWILDFGERFVGLIAVDGASETKKQPAETAIIRHFYVDEPYRVAGVQKDLLEHAVRHTFDSDPTVQRIETTTSALTSYAQRSLAELGFRTVEKTKRVGILGWELERRVLERGDWNS
ncbi:hypothetical protein K435DRAFT_826698 [Dendrothele bispora CBS 962.96]|uniref:N-acetyltransferase domain-containing protein n=1 Tax=Dendrothele bispora (strain CBS 962.96) TaxID=1314807 RepID=A0A4S8MRB3_DENBC|nr:hypothetical protein K435DRAFT_826698 [Dendrothele bispora CBS 962.96]